MRLSRESVLTAVMGAGLVACGGGGSGGAAPVITSFTVGGMVTGLSGSGLILKNGGNDDAAISASGAFTFATGLQNGATYSVTVATQPSAPAQDCIVTNGSG